MEGWVEKLVGQEFRRTVFWNRTRQTSGPSPQTEPWLEPVQELLYGGVATATPKPTADVNGT